MKALTKEAQQSITPDKAIQILKEGNQRFINNQKSDRDLLQQVNETAQGQYPFAVILSCIDSRTSSELVFDLGIGDIFNARIAGNILNEDILGSMEFACKVAGSKLVVVLGHTKCGAIYGACNHVELGNLTSLLEKVQPAIDMEDQTPEGERTGSNGSFVHNVTINNVQHTIDRIRKESQVLADMEKNGEIKIIGGMYDVETGKVNFFEDAA